MSAVEEAWREWVADVEDPLVRRLDELDWGAAPSDVRARCWQSFDRQLPRPHTSISRTAVLTSGAPQRQPQGAGRTFERYSFTRRVLEARPAMVQEWARRSTRTPSMSLA